MSFPVVIAGTGQIYGEIKLLGFADENQRTLSDAEFRSQAVALDHREVEYFGFIMRQLREVLGAAAFIRRSKNLNVAVTDGGYLSYADPRRERIAVPYQLLREGVLPIPETARRLVLEDAMINAVYTLQGDKFCRGLQRFVDRFANPAWPLWYSRQQVVTTLCGLHRYLKLDIESQILLRDAYERIELGDGGRQPYSQILREIQGSHDDELRSEHVGRAIALVSMTPALFPDFVDRTLLTEIEQQFSDGAGGIKATEAEIYKWMLAEHRQTRDVSEVLWKEQIETALGMERCLRGINLRHNLPSDVLRKISDLAPLAALKELYLAGEAASTAGDGTEMLDQFAHPVEEFCRELQANLSLGIQNIRTYLQLIFNWVAELQEVGRYPGDRIEFLQRFAERLKKAGCTTAEYAARAYADAIDEELRFKVRQRAAEERSEAVARERSQLARQRLQQGLIAARGTADAGELSAILRQHLVTEGDLLTDDARGAINDVLAEYFEHPEVSQKLMAQLERQAKDPQAAAAFREAMQKRYSLTHDRHLSYKGFDSTQLFEIYTNLLLFEDHVPELEDAEGKLDIRREADCALDREKGVLRGQLFGKKTGWVTDITTGELGARLGHTVQELRQAAESGKPKALAELADTHFRLGVFAAVHGNYADALSHMRETVRLSMTDELIETADRGILPRKINPKNWKLANKWFRANHEIIRRAKAAANYLELFARRAERALDSGRRPEIEPDLLDKILGTLETERVLGDKAPNFKILRLLPRIETIGKHEYRICDLLPAGAGGQAGQMALLRHVFADEPFAPFMGYKVVETEREDKSIGRYMTKVGINNYVRGEYLKVFPRLFPNFEGEMVRQRNGLPNQVFAARFISELLPWMKRRSRDDVQHVRTFEAKVVEVVDRAKRFPVLMLEFVPGLNDDLPKTVYSHQADADGNLGRKPQSIIAAEKAAGAIRDSIADRLVRDSGLEKERIRPEHLRSLLARLRAHSAALAVLMMNVDHQIFTVDGSLIAMDYEILFAPCFDPEWDAPLDPGDPVSTYFTKRINVSWVSERDDLDPYLEVAGLYREFVLEKVDVLMDWAMEAGFLLSEAGAVKDILARNAQRLQEDVQTLIDNGGTVYLTANRRDTDSPVEYGAVVPRNERRRGMGAGGLADLLAGRASPAHAGEPKRAASLPEGELSEMTARLQDMQKALATPSPFADAADSDKTIDLSGAGTARGGGDEEERTLDLSGAGAARPVASGAHRAGTDESTIALTPPAPSRRGDDGNLNLFAPRKAKAPAKDEEKTLDLEPQPAARPPADDGEDSEKTINLK